MTFLQILPSILSILSTVVIALVGWGYRSDRAAMKKDILKNADDIEKLASRQAEKVERLETNLNDLKSDLPLIYVLREDFIRTMNNVESRIVGIDGKIDRLLEKVSKGGGSDG